MDCDCEHDWVPLTRDDAGVEAADGAYISDTAKRCARCGALSYSGPYFRMGSFKIDVDDAGTHGTRI